VWRSRAKAKTEKDTMTGSGDRIAAARKRAGPKAALFRLSLLLGFGVAATLPMQAAQAQYFPAPWSYPYYDGYPPPRPPGTLMPSRRMAADESGPRVVGSDMSYGVVPLAEIRRRVALLGFHLIAMPRHKDRIYLAEAEDAHGLRHRLVFDAYEGNVIEDTKLAVIPKKPPLKPSAGAASLPAKAKKKTAAETQASDKPAAVTAESKAAQDADKK
jgi:hypothetical protein